MKKRMILLLAALALCLALAVPAAAADGFSENYDRLIDMAGLLSPAENEILLQQLDEISERQQFELAVITVESLGGSPIVDYADDLYDYCEFGYGPAHDGAMLLISVDDGEWYITTCGYGITAFTDAGIDYIGDQMHEDLSAGDFGAAIRTFAMLGDHYVTQARNGTPVDRSSLPREALSLIWIPICLVLGLVIALIAVGGMKHSLHSVRPQRAAAGYVREGSMTVTERRDFLLYRQVTRTEKPKQEGSSTHKSSSGVTHGGGGGKF